MDIYEKSLEFLKKIAKNQGSYGYKIYLVGGWAVWSYNPYTKSKDIDIIIKAGDFWKLREYLLSAGFRETTGDHLGKKGFAMLYEEDKIEIDVYDEKIGPFDVEPLIKNAAIRKMEYADIAVISLDDLLTLKVFTALERLGTPKGEKDLADIVALLDKHIENLKIDEVNQKANFRKIAGILFSEYKTTVKFYPIGFQQFQNIKKQIEKKMP